jgi:hypothetical protein
VAAGRVDELLKAIRGLSQDERKELLARARSDQLTNYQVDEVLSFVGMFADEPEIVDAICEDAMAAREQTPLRLPSE